VIDKLPWAIAMAGGCSACCWRTTGFLIAQLTWIDRRHGERSFIHILVPHFPVQKGLRAMPITVDAELQELPYDLASRVAYDVMHEVFAVHNEFGRFMDENIYRDEIARRVPGVRAEVLIEVTFREFRKPISWTCSLKAALCSNSKQSRNWCIVIARSC
jgi:hypothetical protein